MEDKLTKLQEQISFLQNDIVIISDELFHQQKEIKKLNAKIFNLEKKIQVINSDPNIQNLNVNEKPPHY